MQTGNIENAMLNAYNYLVNSFICGRNLVELERELESFGKTMMDYKQMGAHGLVCNIKRLVSNLLVSNDRPSLLEGQKSEQKYLLERAMKENDTMLICKIYIFGIIEAYIFGEYELAADMIRKKEEVEGQMSRPCLYYGLTDFYDGLVFLALAHKSSEFEWTSEIRDIMAKMEKFASIGKSNNEHKLRLLEAEMKSRIGEEGNAIEQYKLAIAASEKNGFIHEQAIANERAADFFLRNGNKSKASRYYGEANNLYLRWGAQGKADELCKSIPF
mmetsp:Transcript_27179/g.39394  ORF Transcript_27179/g.39394 Transcript_27179/m.39394 type:complete len:273 (+) Transcript_27179:3-821(+)